jgi:hypothetical protein
MLRRAVVALSSRHTFTCMGRRDHWRVTIDLLFDHSGSIAATLDQASASELNNKRAACQIGMVAAVATGSHATSGR